MQKMGLTVMMMLLIWGSLAFLWEAEAVAVRESAPEVSQTEEPELSVPVILKPEEDEPEEEQPVSRTDCLLINGENPIPEEYVPDLVQTGRQNTWGDSRAAAALNLMLRAGEREGLSFVVCSGYRTREEQQVLFLNQIKKKLDEGMGYQEGLEEASKISARPGTSEHESGLAFDIVALDYQTLDEGYAETQEAKWLLENSSDYGFILRYPRGKEEITGIIWEPWHYRYVGVSIAKKVTEKGFTLEEYLAEN